MPTFNSVKEFEPGQPVPAGRLQQISDQSRSSRVILGDGLSGRQLPSGQTVSLEVQPEAWVKITGAGSTSGTYTGTEQLSLASGTWTNGTRLFTSSSPLMEINLNTSVATGLIVRAWLPRTSTIWLFQRGSC
jgi:hypothetical protein